MFAVLAARGLTVSDQTRALILACKDVPQLERWLRGAATAASLEEVFVKSQG